MNRKTKDLTGQRFGNWIVLKQGDFKYDKSNHKIYCWICICDCEYCKTYGKETRNVRESNLLKGISKTCGRLHKSKIAGVYNKKYNKYDLTGEFGIGYTFKDEPFYFDLEDYDLIKDYCWHKHKDGYLRTKFNNKMVLQHRLIMNCLETELEIDHKNRQPNYNLKSNLILVTHIVNMKNYGLYENNKSGFIGVFYNILKNEWTAKIQFNNERIYLGKYNNKEDAIIARLKKEKELFASINKKAPQEKLFEKYGIA